MDIGHTYILYTIRHKGLIGLIYRRKCRGRKLQGMLAIIYMCIYIYVQQIVEDEATGCDSYLEMIRKADHRGR